MIPALVLLSLLGIAGTILTAIRRTEPIQRHATMIGFWAGLAFAGFADPQALPVDIIWVLLTCAGAGSGAGFVLTPMADPDRISTAVHRADSTEATSEEKLELALEAAPSTQEWIAVAGYGVAALILIVGGSVLGESEVMILGSLGFLGSFVSLIRFARFRGEVSSWRRRLDPGSG